MDFYSVIHNARIRIDDSTQDAMDPHRRGISSEVSEQKWESYTKAANRVTPNVYI